MAENPERLWVFEVGDTTRVACATAADASAHHAHVEDKDRVSPVAEYVLASVARGETEASVKRAIEEERARAWETCHVDE